jgi:sulfatase maturation enzyme AslB (radical SAM superfamily)
MGAFLEISTSIPCVLNCKYCPQEVLKNSYKSEVKNLSIANFKIAIDKLPEQSTITWSAFNEPFQNEDTTKMILYAHGKGHKLQVNTALTGLTVEKYNLIKNLPFSHFGIHLPDSEGKTKINITPQYKVLLKYIINNPPSNLDLNHHAGELHSDIKGMTDKSHKLIINNRCGLIREGRVDYHSNVLKCGHQFQFTHDEGGCVLLPNGDCVTCCQSFNLQEKLGNLFTQSWEEIKANIKLMEMCTHCRYVIE